MVYSSASAPYSDNRVSLDHKRNVSDGVVSGVERNWKRSDSSDSDSVALMISLTTPIFDFHEVVSALTTPRTTPTIQHFAFKSKVVYYREGFSMVI